MRTRLVVLGALAAAVAADSPAAAGPRSTLEAVAPPSRARGATVARIVAPAFARRRIASRERGRRIGMATAWSGQPQTLLVLDAATRRGRGWVQLRLASRPNGAAGWVPRARVRLRRTRWWIDVRTRARLVSVFRDGRRVRRMRAVVGTPATPTPHGLAAIYEINRQPDPHAFLGPWVLSLTAHSNVLRSFGGGPGRVGIHGRSGASLRDPLGTAASHGCIRVDNRHVAWMARRIPPGTPVNVRG